MVENVRNSVISELSSGEDKDGKFQKVREKLCVEVTMEGNEKYASLKEGNRSKKLGALKSFHSRKWRHATLTVGIKCARKSRHR